jgi:hypothetical protein
MDLKLDLQASLYEDVNLTHLIQNRDQWRAVMNMLTSIGLHKRPIISWEAEQLIVFQEGIFSQTRPEPQGPDLRTSISASSEFGQRCRNVDKGFAS